MRRWFYGDPAHPDLLTKYVDPENNEFLYAYHSTADPFAVTSITLPPAQPGGPVGTINLDYWSGSNNKGLLHTVIDANGVATVFKYDNTGQPLSETEGSGSGNWKVQTDYTFDAVTRLISSHRGGTTANPLAGSPPLGPGALPPTGGAIYDANNRVTGSDCIWKHCGGGCLNQPPGCSSTGTEPCCPDAFFFGRLEGNIDDIQYDDMDRPVSAQFSLLNTATGENSLIFYNLNWDELGRLTHIDRGSPEATAHIAGTPLVNRTESFSYNWTTGVFSRDSANGVRTSVTTDGLYRVQTVGADEIASDQQLYSAKVTYQAKRDLVSSVSYSNGTRIDYEYDKIDRVSKISHSVVGGPAPFLQMIYSYDKRDLITRVLEIDEQHQAGTITYTYDARGRLIEERRTGSHAYHLAYTYDQGGNRTSKTDSANGTYTLYHYDTDADSTAPHKANRLLYYDTFEGTDATGPQVEAVIYTYALQGPAAGNVTQIRRKVAGADGWPFHVVSTCMKYNEQGELWVVTERTWISFGWGWADGTSITPNTVKSRQFRGIGQQRYMMRDLDTSDVVNPSYAILPGTAVWTDYDGNWPTSDYTIDATGSPVAGTDYETGFAEIDPLGQVTYMHTDPIGTTRAITDDTGAPTTRPVYTAFGEPVFEDGSVGTRYRYAGAWGYEDFADQDWGTVDWDGNGPNNPVSLDFPYLHVGHRYYDPATGRFLQRDPIGIAGGANVYAYLDGNPLNSVDPSGLDRWYIRRDGHSEVWFPRPGGGYNGYDFGPADDSVIGGTIDAIVGGPGQINKNGSSSLPEGAHPHKSTPEQDAADQREIDRQIKSPPRFQIIGLGGAYNCIGWASEWAKKHEPYDPPARIPWVCFVAGTPIATQGGTRRIESIRRSDPVLSLASPNVRAYRSGVSQDACLSLARESAGVAPGKQTAGRNARSLVSVSRVFSAWVYELIYITLPTETIVCTPEHPFWVLGRGWVRAKNLRIEDELLSVHGSAVTIANLSFERAESPVKVYNLSVGGPNTYFVGESAVLVHNKGPW